MPWDSSDRRRILLALGYAIDQVSIDLVQAAMNRVQLLEPTAVAEIQDLLFQLETIMVQVNTNAAKGNLKKIDVIEYFPGGASAGLVQQAQDLTNRLRGVLGLVSLDANLPPSLVLGA